MGIRFGSGWRKSIFLSLRSSPGPSQLPCLLLFKINTISILLIFNINTTSSLLIFNITTTNSLHRINITATCSLHRIKNVQQPCKRTWIACKTCCSIMT